MDSEFGVFNLASVTSSGAVASIMVDRGQTVTAFTEPARAVFDLSRLSEGARLGDLPCRLEISDLTDSVNKALEKGQCHSQWVAGKHGQWKIYIYPRIQGDGQVSGAVLSFLEAGGPRAVEQEVLALMENAPDIIARFDRDHRYTYLNKTAEKVTGIKAAEFIGKTKRELGMPENLCALWDSALDRVFADGKEQTMEFTFPGARDVKRFQSRLCAERSLDGRVATVLSVTRDITKQYEAEQKMLRRLASNRKLIEVTRRVLSETTMGGLLQTMVDAARELTGARLGTSGYGYRQGVFRVGAVSNDPEASPCPPGEIFQVHRGGIFMEIIEKGASINFSERELQRHPGWWGLPEGHAPLRGLLGVPLYGTAEDPIGLIMVSDKAKGGDFSAHDQGLMEHLASVANLGLKHIELRKQAEAAKQRALSASQAKSDFLSNMSHEIRTPLNSLIGLSNLLLDSELTPEQREWSQGMQTSANHLLNLVDDILDFSKIESQQLVIQEVDFDLMDELDEVIDIMAPKVHEKGLEFIVHAPVDIPRSLNGDPGRLKQIWINLLGNALKFTEVGQIMLKCALLDQNRESALLRFEVSDTGPGIAEDKQQELFERFVRLNNVQSRAQGGTGLGLAICKNLAALMDGQIGVTSRLGLGSAFWFTVRLGKAAINKSWDEDLTALPLEICNQRMLVVDDNQAARAVLRDYLRSWNCRVSVADGPRQAEEHCRRASDEGDPYNLLIIDQTLQEAEGLEVGGRLKQAYNRGEGLLILMMPWGVSELEESLKGAGVSAVLRKPVSASALFDCLVTLQGREPGAPIYRRERNKFPEDPLLNAKRGEKMILVVEDNQTNSMVALAVLRKLGYRAEAVTGGEEALKALAASDYDLLLMDIQMPGMDGLETTRAIRGLDNGLVNRQVPIVALTANANIEERDEALRAGMDDYLSKPIRPAALAMALDRYLLDGAAEKINASAAMPGGRPAGEEEVFIESEALNRVADDRDLFAEIFTMFAQDLPLQLQKLRQALERGQNRIAQDTAHTIKGAAANLSAPRSREAARAVEEAVRNGDLELAHDLADKLEQEIGHLLETVSQRGLA